MAGVNDGGGVMKSINEVKFEAGDCIISTSDGFFSAAIKFLTSWQTKDAWASHAAGAISVLHCIEAVGKAKINPISRYDKPEQKIKVYRLPLRDDQRLNFQNGAYNIANGAYGWTKLPLFALDAIATKITSLFGRKKPVFIFTKYFGILNIPVCSQLYLYILEKYCRYSLLDEDGRAVSWKIVSPDYLDDLLNLSTNSARAIYSQNV